MAKRSKPHHLVKPSPNTGDVYESEIRKHYFLDRYIIVAPKRNLRPDAFAGPASLHKLESAATPKIEDDPAIYEIRDRSGRWQVKVINNAFPALTTNNIKAFGKQEIVIECSEHNREFSELSLEQIERVFQVYIARTTILNHIKGIVYVAVFKNDGPKAGASIAHAHSQIIALPIIPPTVQEDAEGFDSYVRQNGRCPVCDVIKWEQEQKVRIIYEDKRIIAISPYATRYPFGVWVLPQRHVGKFADLTISERKSIAVILKMITAKLDLSNISFNFFLQDSLKGEDHHFVLKVEPRPNVWAGLELSTGVVINPVPPEYAALWYLGKVK